MLGETIKAQIKTLPVVGPLAQRLKQTLLRWSFRNSDRYWENRYRHGGDSGAGSYGRLASFKAEILNRFVAEASIQSIIELGCGDGAQLSLLDYPAYVGVDVSKQAVATCRSRFASSKHYRFFETRERERYIEKYDLALSLDVIYHLVEDEVFDTYMRDLFDLSERYVVIYSSNLDERPASPHVRHRIFTDWVERNAPAWQLSKVVKNRYPIDPEDPGDTSFADFYFFEQVLTTGRGGK